MKKLVSMIALAALVAAPAFAQAPVRTKTATASGKVKTKKTVTTPKGKTVTPPDGATALCGDGSFSFSKSRKPCEGRNGVVELLPEE